MNKLSNQIKICQIVYSGYGGHTDLALDLSKNFANEFSKISLIFYGYQKLPISYIKFCKIYKIPYFNLNYCSPLIDWCKIFFFLIRLNCNTIIIHTGTVLPVALFKFFFNAKIISVYHQSIYLKTKKEKFKDYIQFHLSNINIVITKDYYEYFFAKFKKKNLYLIRNGIKLDRFYKKKEYKKKKSFNFGMASRFIKTKGHKLLIECFKDLPRNMILRFAGSGDLENELKKILKKYKNKNIYFDGYVPKNEMSQWFNKIDYYLHISDGETMSLSIMQAMAMGKVVITSDVSGINNMIRNKYNGYLVKNSKKNIIRTIKQVTSDPTYNLNIIKNAQKFAKKNFNLCDTAQSYKKIIYKLFDEKNFS